ncbi:MAG TPA: ABC transporter ATP-binding protein [Anaerolineales bacterium]|nr:ABC transporter ATP-binding protein [Anaerolineales bacterium]
MHHTLEVRNLHYTYPDGQAALRGVDLFVAPGEKVALVGPNGAGKSTLILHLNGILHGQGEVRVCSLPMEDVHLGRIRASVGVVFQDPDDQLFSPSVAEDVAFGPLYMGLAADEVEKRVRSALAAVGMPGAGGRVSHHLSGGEKKRVAIASVLSMEPEILVLDEPTAGLDPRGRRGLIRLLAALPQTMLVSTHDLRMVAELFARTVVLDQGKVVADGPTADLMADAGLLAAHGLEA